MVGGVSAEVDGGKFGHGFASALLSIGADKIGLHHIENLGGRIVANAIVGGSISELTGGKFANGAMSAAFRVAFNDSLNTIGRKKATQLVDKVMTFEGGRHADRVAARALAIDIAQTPGGYAALSTGNAKEGIRVIVTRNIDRSLTYSNRNSHDLIVLNLNIHDFGEAV